MSWARTTSTCRSSQSSWERNLTTPQASAASEPHPSITGAGGYLQKLLKTKNDCQTIPLQNSWKQTIFYKPKCCKISKHQLSLPNQTIAKLLETNNICQTKLLQKFTQNICSDLDLQSLLNQTVAISENYQYIYQPIGCKRSELFFKGRGVQRVWVLGQLP